MDSGGRQFKLLASRKQSCNSWEGGVTSVLGNLGCLGHRWDPCSRLRHRGRPRTSHDLVRAVSVGGPVVCCQIVLAAEYVVLSPHDPDFGKEWLWSSKRPACTGNVWLEVQPPRHGDCDVLTPATDGEGFEKYIKQARRSDEGYCKPRPLDGQGALQRSGPGRVIGGGGSWTGRECGL